MGDTGELGAPQAVQLWDPNGLGCFQEGQEGTPNPVFWIHLRQFLFRSFKVFTGDLKQTLEGKTTLFFPDDPVLQLLFTCLFALLR